MARQRTEADDAYLAAVIDLQGNFQAREHRNGDKLRLSVVYRDSAYIARVARLLGVKCKIYEGAVVARIEIYRRDDILDVIRRVRPHLRLQKRIDQANALVAMVKAATAE